jgi:hypothetical protein
MIRTFVDHKRRAEAIARQLVASARAQGREVTISDIAAAKGAHPAAITAALGTEVKAEPQ